MTLRILIADDHRLFRQGLAALLREQSGWEVVGEAADGEEAIRLAEALAPDVAVIDVEMPRVGGVEAARGFRRVSRDTHIVALSMYIDSHYQERMRQAGALAYVLKNEAIDDLVGAIRAVLRGESFTSAAVVRRESVVAVRSAQIDSEELSEREREVLRLLAEGLRTKEIAVALGISPKTVETYRSRLMQKLGIDNVSGLVRFAIRIGLVSPDA
jgi:DNA-binding NarL/FixJ family response regulator